MSRVGFNPYCQVSGLFGAGVSMGFVALARPRGCAVAVPCRGLGQQMAAQK